MAVKDRDLARLGPWPQGINNLVDEGDLPVDENGNRLALREAENVDLDRAGHPRRRRGAERFFNGALTHSLWSSDELDFGLFVNGGALHVVYANRSTEQIDAAPVGNLPLSYALIGDRIYYSNRSTCGMLTLDLQALQWSPEAPTGQPLLSAVDGFGLDAGRYQVAVTFVDRLNRESGSSVAALIELTGGQGIQLDALPVPADPLSNPTVNVYVSDANGKVLRLHATVPAGTQTGVITEPRRGRSLVTQHLKALPAGQIVRSFNGRQVVACGAWVLWSEPLRFGLFDPTRNRVHLPGDVELCEPVGSGMGSAGGFYVAARGKTYWLGGSEDPGKFTIRPVYPHGAVPGTATVIGGDVVGFDSADPVVVWLARSGHFIVGLPNGQIVVLKKGEAAVNNADSGATLYRAGRGLHQLITALRGPQEQSLSIGDRAVAHIVHRDS